MAGHGFGYDAIQIRIPLIRTLQKEVFLLLMNVDSIMTTSLYYGVAKKGIKI